MRSAYRKIVWLLYTATFLVLTEAQNFHGRFQVDTTAGQSTKGSCGWVGLNNLNAIWADVVNLAASGLDVIQRYGNDPEATRLVDAFFQSKSNKARLNANQIAAIQGNYQKISNWIGNGGSVNGGKLNSVPNLFCHHTWAQPQSISSQAYDKNGNGIVNSKNKPVTLRQVPAVYNDYVALRKTTKNTIPVFSWVHTDYFFDTSYGPKPNDFVCTPTNSEAQTMFFNDAFATVTLCPISFGTGSQTAAKPSIRTLGQVAPNPVTLADYKSRLAASNLGGVQKLQDLLATAVTLYHEVFHLVLGSDPGVSKPRSVDEIYGVPDCLKATAANAVLNPETYAYVANAWWITQNQKYGTGNADVEFFTGYSTY